MRRVGDGALERGHGARGRAGFTSQKRRRWDGTMKNPLRLLVREMCKRYGGRQLLCSRAQYFAGGNGTRRLYVRDLLSVIGSSSQERHPVASAIRSLSRGQLLQVAP